GPVHPRRPKGVAIGAATERTTAIGNARVAKTPAERTLELAKLPISVLVSKADGKIVVRHGFRQIFEAPASVRDPDRPLGTHVYTALALQEDGSTMRWQAISVPASGHSVADARKVSRASRSEAEPPFQVASGPTSSAAAARD